MRTVWTILVLVATGFGPVTSQGQQTSTNAVVTATNTATFNNAVSTGFPRGSPTELLLTEPRDTNTMEFMVSKTKVHLSGPLVSPLKAKSVPDFGHRVLHLVSPFGTEQANVSPAATGPVSTRAWSTIVGWSPGRSAFPDGAWHEPPHLNLISVTVEKQPQP